MEDAMASHVTQNAEELRTSCSLCRSARSPFRPSPTCLGSESINLNKYELKAENSSRHMPGGVENFYSFEPFCSAAIHNLLKTFDMSMRHDNCVVIDRSCESIADGG